MDHLISNQPIISELVVVPADQLRLLVSNAVRTAISASIPSLQENTEPELPNLVTRQQAAKLLNVSLSTVDNYIRDGLLSKKRIGSRSVRLERSDVDKLARTT